MRNRKLFALAVGCMMTAGIVSSQAQPSGSVQLNFGNPGTPWAPNTMMVAPTLPPPMWNRPHPIAPGPGMVWVEGNWAWERRRMGVGSRRLDATAGTEIKVVSRPLGSGSSARRFSVDCRALALKEVDSK